ncbi:MAG: 23S rRNA (guanosine(2251)-2'-O)-methyltransferase RlmB [Actinobacteria bacterium]|nr:23S rRNA (guanosine(2251)-2'-O)-methyltransferase RlmB [Actinomycetota bacterium]
MSAGAKGRNPGRRPGRAPAPKRGTPKPRASASGPKRGGTRAAPRPPQRRGTVDPAMRADYRSRGRSDNEIGGDQVEGRQAVRELLLAHRRSVREILVSVDVDAADILDEIIELADDAHVPIKQIGRGSLDAKAKTDAPQGIIARAEPVRAVPLEALLDDTARTAPFLVVVDGVTDPHNLGAMLRSAECAGVTGVVLPRHRAVHITATVAKAAAGAIEHLRFAVVGGIPTAIGDLGSAGVLTVGLDMTGPKTLWDLEGLDAPVAIVVGAEGKGLSRLARQRCDEVARIPLEGRIESLNASVAGALACYEVARARLR